MSGLGTPQWITWQAAQFPQPSDFNTYIRDAFTFLTASTVFRATQGTAQSIPNNANTVIHLDTVAEDTYSGWNATTWTYTAQQTGLYQVTGCYFGNGGHAAGSIAQVLLNCSGTAISGEIETISSTTWGAVVFDQVYMTAGVDTIQLLGYQNSGAALNTFATTPNETSYLEILWVGS